MFQRVVRWTVSGRSGRPQVNSGRGRPEWDLSYEIPAQAGRTGPELQKLRLWGTGAEYLDVSEYLQVHPLRTTNLALR